MDTLRNQRMFHSVPLSPVNNFLIIVRWRLLKARLAVSFDIAKAFETKCFFPRSYKLIRTYWKIMQSLGVVDGIRKDAKRARLYANPYPVSSAYRWLELLYDSNIHNYAFVSTCNILRLLGQILNDKEKYLLKIYLRLPNNKPTCDKWFVKYFQATKF